MPCIYNFVLMLPLQMEILETSTPSSITSLHFTMLLCLWGLRDFLNLFFTLLNFRSSCSSGVQSGFFYNSWITPSCMKMSAHLFPQQEVFKLSTRVFKGFIFHPWNTDSSLQLFVHKARNYFQGVCPISTESFLILQIMQQLQKQKYLRLHAKILHSVWLKICVQEMNIT